MSEAATLDILCQSCGAELSVDAHLRTAQCPYCASPSVVDRPASKDRPDPTFAIGFVLDKERASATVRRWLKTRHVFAHSGLKEALLEKMQGVYVPAWLYGAVAETSYSASIGENYTETETYTTTDSKGRTVVRTRTVVKTEWRDLSGGHTAFVLDVLVTASRGLTNDELEQVEPFDLRALRRYSAGVVSGWVAEEPSLARDECHRMAHDESIEKIGKKLSAFMPGDSHRNLRYRTSLRDEVLDLILLPVWVLAVRYKEGEEPLRVLVNGQSGEVHGKVPLSPVKVTCGVVALLVVVVAAVLLFVGIAGLS